MGAFLLLLVAAVGLALAALFWGLLMCRLGHHDLTRNNGLRWCMRPSCTYGVDG